MTYDRNTSKVKNIFRKAELLFYHNWIFYLVGCVIVLGLKLFYRSASADDLKWMLTPVSRWVNALSGISFTYVPLTGYVSHSREFIIAPSCSGVQFWLIAIAAMLFSYVHRMPHRRAGFVWTAVSVAGSWLYTVFINGIRIVLSIHLPLWFHARGLFTDRFTPEKLHTAIGTAVYFSALMLLCQIGGYLSGSFREVWIKKENAQDERCASSSVAVRRPHDAHVSFLIPAAGYFFIVLGIPFLGRVCRNDWIGFSEYASLVLGICLTLSLLVKLFASLKNLKKRTKTE